VTAIQQNRWDQLLRRAADLKGPGSKVNDALSELFPTFDVEHLPAELYRLAGTSLGFGGGEIIGAAGERPRANIFNPAGSGKLITVTSFIIGASLLSRARFGITTVPIARISTEFLRDTRDAPPTTTTGQIQQVSSAALAPGTNQFWLINDTSMHIREDNGIAVLAPGSGLEMGLQTLASTMNYTFFWRERVAEPSELVL